MVKSLLITYDREDRAPNWIGRSGDLEFGTSQKKKGRNGNAFGKTRRP